MTKDSTTGRAPAHRAQHFKTYVKNIPPNVHRMFEDKLVIHGDNGRVDDIVFVHRPLNDDADVVNMKERRTYYEFEYSDGCVCYCYRIGQSPIRAHMNLPKFDLTDWREQRWDK